jgi:hypothetical protein
MRIVRASGILKCQIFALNRELSLGKEVNSVAGTGEAGGVIEVRSITALVDQNVCVTGFGVVGELADQIESDLSAAADSSKSVSVERGLDGRQIDIGEDGMVRVVFEAAVESGAGLKDAVEEMLEAERWTISGGRCSGYEPGNISKSIFDSSAARSSVLTMDGLSVNCLLM